MDSCFLSGPTDFRWEIAEIRNCQCPYDGHTEFILIKKRGNGRTDSTIKKNTDRHGLKNGRPWPSLANALPKGTTTKDSGTLSNKAGV